MNLFCTNSKTLLDIYNVTPILTDRGDDMKNRIQEILTEQGLTQRELAVKLDVSEAQVNKWITG